MERLCFTFTIKPGTEDEYRRRHDEIWPELVEAITAAGFRNYSLFRRGLQVIAYAECVPDVDAAFGSLAGADVNRRWSEWFTDIIDSLTDDDGNIHRAQEVWHLD
ncbi:L-rhamnose mutarotase [soil metagenome]